MQGGSPLNRAILPNPKNIADDTSLFLTWWSPGQYLIPGWLAKMSSLSLGAAAALTVVGFSVLGLVGLAALYRHFGFSPTIVAASLSLIAAQRSFSTPFVTYTGGEVLLFGGAPWILLQSLKCRDRPLLLPVFLVPTSLLAFLVLKSSYLVTLIAILSALWVLCLNEAPEVEDRRGFHFDLRRSMSGAKLAYGLLLAGIGGAVYAVLSITFIGKGPNPTTVVWTDYSLADALAFPLAAPLLTSFSLEDFVHQVTRIAEILGLSLGTLSPLALTGFYNVAAALSAYLMIRVLRTSRSTYAACLFSFLMVFVTFFSYQFTTKTAISFDGRHLRMSALLLLPGLLEHAFSTPRGKNLQIPITVLAIIGVAYGVAAFSWRKLEIYRHYIVIDERFETAHLDARTLQVLRELDGSQDPNTLFYLTHPELFLVVHHNRWYATHQEHEAATKIGFEVDAYHGTVNRLIFCFEKRLDDPEQILARFVDYDHITLLHETGDFAVYEGIADETRQT